MVIIASHVRFMEALKVQGRSRDDLPYKACVFSTVRLELGIHSTNSLLSSVHSPGQPYASYVAFSFTGLVALTKGFDSIVGGFQYVSFITSAPFPFFRDSRHYPC